MDEAPLYVDIKPSKLKLYFLMAAHSLAVLSILLINQAALAVIGKVVLICFLVLSFKHYYSNRNSKIHLSIKNDNLVDLTIENENYGELRISSGSYVADIYVQLVLSDVNSGVCQKISIFPDSLDAAMHSLLRARLKRVSTITDSS